MDHAAFSSAMSAELSANPLPMGRVFPVLDAIENRIQAAILAMIAQYGEQVKAHVKEWALAWFDSFDVPYIGGVLEAAVKDAVRPLLAQGIDYILANVGG